MASRPLRMVPLSLLVASACVHIDGPSTEDARLGDFGRVRFVGGDGCNDSTTLAVGATAELTLEPQAGAPLPSDLGVASDAPSTIGASQGEARDELVLVAHREGSAMVELRSEGEVWDRLEFAAEPAAAVTYEAADAVFASGTYLLKVSEVYGACGEECPLIGSGFLAWSAEPEGSLRLAGDEDRVAAFVAATETAAARVVGQEPVTGAALVDHPVTVVSAEGAGELEARLVLMLLDGTLLEGERPPAEPAEIPVGALLLVELSATSAGGDVVPIAGADVTWTVEGDAAAVEMNPDGIEPAAEGPVFAAVEPGEVTLEGRVAIIDRSTTVALTVTAQ